MASSVSFGSSDNIQMCGDKERCEGSIRKVRPTTQRLTSVSFLRLSTMSTVQRWAAAFVVLAIVWRILVTFFLASKPGHCGGYVHPALQEVKDVFCTNVANGKEPGGSFAVYRQGKPLVNLWGGFADQTSHKQWTQGTLSQAWSSTKGVTAVVMAMLVDRGLLDYSKPVYAYWPEFAANGKKNITVAMLLSHQAGLISLSRQLNLAEYRDNWQEVERLMADQTPVWTPGAQCAYHAFTFGMYADALVRKVDPQHRNISQFFRDEIARPFDLDFYIGLPADQYFRSARGTYVSLVEILLDKYVMKPSMWGWLPEVLLDSRLSKALTVFDFMDDMNKMNDADLQSIGLSSSQGFGTAEALAKLYDYLANGGDVKGKRLLSPQQVRALSTPVTENIPVIAAPKLPVAMGMIIEKNMFGQPVFGHRGYGGQNAYADPSQGIGVTYITNFNSRYSDSDDPRALELIHVLYRALQNYHALSDDHK